MWSNKTKATGDTATLKSKVSSNINYEILTPDGLEIMVGAGEDMVLSFQEATSLWSDIAKIQDHVWSNKTKFPIV